MIIRDMQAIILAAGKSSRFNTGRSKLLEKICGQEMILYLTTLFAKLQIPTVAIVGFQKELVQDVITHHHGDTVTFIEQKEQRGTGHALLCTQQTWHKDHVLVVNGDMPLITEKIIEDLYQKHINSDAAMSIVVAHQADLGMGAYGRLVITKEQMEIVEARDFKGDAAEHCFINAGIYLIKRSFLEHSITKLVQHENSAEFYIVDLVKIASSSGWGVQTLTVPFDQIRGINTLQELWIVEQIKKAELIAYWMYKGVRFYDPQNVQIEVNVAIGAGTHIGSGVHVLRGSNIGNNVVIREYVSVSNSTIGDEVTVHPYSVITDSVVEDNAHVGPFAHLRSHAHIGHDSVIGNFVEIKQSTVGNHTKAKHLSYLGDATIGIGVNIGAGTITCNHDSVNHNKTTICDGAYIGSNTTLVAPVIVNKEAFTAAGSVITDDVPEQALALGRARQVIKEHYAPMLKGRLQKRKHKDALSYP